MPTGVLAGVIVPVTSVVTSPGVFAAQIDPASLADASRPIRAAASFLTVLLVGGVLRVRFGGLLDRAVDDVMDRPRVAVIYGILAYGLLVFAGFYLNDMLIRAGMLDSPLAFAMLSVLIVGVVVLSSFGFLVVGTIVTDLRTGSRSRQAPVFGAVISTVPWLVLPVTAGAVAWLAVAAFGVGGRTRTWVHATRPVEPDHPE
jgi:hypothetical protein